MNATLFALVATYGFAFGVEAARPLGQVGSTCQGIGDNLTDPTTVARLANAGANVTAAVVLDYVDAVDPFGYASAYTRFCFGLLGLGKK